MDTIESYLSEQKDPITTDPPRFLREIAYERIKDAIQHANLLPGQPLSETRLSKVLGISRTPVREALQQLAQEGLVHIIPGRAVTIAALSVQEVLNAVHVRSILEPEVARLAADSISKEKLDLLWQALKNMEEAASNGDRPAWSKSDSTFHEILSETCPNQLLGELAIQIRNRVSYLATDVHTTDERIAMCTTEHRRVLEAIADGDGHLAAKEMREHINMLRENLFRRLMHT